MKKISLSILFLSLLASPLVYAATINPESPDLAYRVRQGDTLGKIAGKYLGSSKRWQELASFNKLSNAHLIEVGQILHIRTSIQKFPTDSATIVAITGMVRSNGKPLAVGDRLAAGAKLETSVDSALRMRLPDGSLVSLLEQTRLHVEELAQKHGDSIKSVLRLISGHIDAYKTKHPDGESDLKIQTQTSVLGVRGTHFRLRHVKETSYAEIEEGLVSYDADKTPQTLALSGEQGSVADGRYPATVIPLLPPPAYPALPAEFRTPCVEWTMPEMSGALSYVGELASDEDFSAGVISVRGQGRDISIPNLANGKYWLRLRAVDIHGLQGMESKTALTVHTPPRMMALIKSYVSSDMVQFRWIGDGEHTAYQIQVSDTQNFDRLILDTRSGDNTTQMFKPQSGRYFVRARPVSKDQPAGPWDVPVMFEVH